MRIERAMQIVGYVLYAMAGGLRLWTGGDAAPPAWIAAYAVFGAAFHVASRGRHRLAALGVMTPAMLAMAMIRPCPYGAFTLVIVASQAALAVRPALAAAWVVAQTAVVGACVIGALGWVLGIAEVIALLGFQAFAVVAIAAARRETAALAVLARVQERTRIARDLHDVLGHNLTALGLQLEIASHLPPAAAAAHTAKARAITSRLLHDVRAVVAAMRDDRPRPLGAAIRAIVVDAPGLAVHVDAPESLVIDEPARADCVVRCVQEIVTNTRRHAVGAANLWVRLRCEADELVVEAHDDGQSAVPPGDGSGLRGMRARLEEMGGALEVRTAPEFALTARLPIGGAS